MKTIIVPVDFPTIQEAIDAAESGDEVLVLEGFYKENVVIRKDDITLRGNSFPVEILGDGIGFGITVEGNNVKLINLDVKGFLVGIAFRGNDYTLDEMISDENGEFGIVIFGDNGSIKNGSFSNNGIAGIIISGRNNSVINNRINNNVEVGLGSFYGPLEDTSFCDNIILSKSSADIQDKSIGVSFNLSSSKNNVVKNNTINSNIGVLSNGDSNTFENNIVLASSRAAFIISARSNTISKNKISQSPNGIILNGCNNRVSDNTLSIISAIGVDILGEGNSIERNLFVEMKVGISSACRNSICENKYISVCENVIC